jgi:hypothetical protein
MRRTLALLALVGLVVSSGCLSLITGGGVNDERLDQQPEAAYDWDADSDVHITISDHATYQAVYNLSAAENDRIELYHRDALGTQTPLRVRSLRYRYPNGTVINGSQIDDQGGTLESQREQLVVEPPVDGGQLAFSGDSTPKRFALPTFVDGSYTIVLPEERRVGVPLFGRISPGADDVSMENGQVHIRWDDLSTNTVVVQYYLQRDLQIFAAAAGILSLVGIVGLAYYRRQLQELRETREELGLKMDVEDDRDDPPPGMG